MCVNKYKQDEMCFITEWHGKFWEVSWQCGILRGSFMAVLNRGCVRVEGRCCDAAVLNRGCVRVEG